MQTAKANTYLNTGLIVVYNPHTLMTCKSFSCQRCHNLVGPYYSSAPSLLLSSMVSNFCFILWINAVFSAWDLSLFAPGPAVPEVNRPSVWLLLCCCLPVKKWHNSASLYEGKTHIQLHTRLCALGREERWGREKDGMKCIHNIRRVWNE